MKIKVIETYKESIQNIHTHKREWLRVAAGPLIVSGVSLFILIISMISTNYYFGFFKYFLDYQESSPDAVFFNLALFIFEIILTIATMNAMINGYRYVVLQEIDNRLINVYLNRRFFRLFLYTILLDILGGAYTSAAAGIVINTHLLLENKVASVILISFFIFWGIYILYRITLFPIAISLAESQPFKTSWRLLKGNVWQIIGLDILIYLTILAVGLIGGLVITSVLFGLFMLLVPLGIMLKVTLLAMGAVLAMLWIVLLVLYGLALTSKAMGSIYQQLSSSIDSTEPA